jgi:hypothetical protein
MLLGKKNSIVRSLDVNYLRNNVSDEQRYLICVLIIRASFYVNSLSADLN